MFGYFRPFDAVYSWDSRHAFCAHYCRLCYCMRGIGGQVARGLTTFDIAVYSLILNISTGGQPPAFFDCQKIRKDNVRYFSKDKIGMKLAYLSFLAFNEKIQDDLVDGNVKRGKFMYSLFKKAIKKSKEAEPELDKLVHDNLAKLYAIENGDSPTTESLLECYGNGMVEVFSTLGDIPDGAKKLYKAIAKWTYFVDMLCDYDEDFATGALNTLKREDCPTLLSLFDKEYAYLMQINQDISNDILEGLESIRTNSTEWTALYEILTYALNNVISGLLNGKDVTFHYFKEYHRNVKIVQNQHKLVKRRHKGNS